MFFFCAAMLISCPGKSKSQNQETTDSKRPNIIVVLCDDLGYADVGFNGSEDIQTPQLDKLANEGAIFTSAYVAHPFCGPSRTSIMTGRYAHSIGAQFNLPRNSETIGEGVSLDEAFISKVLQNEGYYTGIIGKWHLGAADKFHPNRRGFDEFYGFRGGGHKYFPDQYRAAYQKQVKAGKKVIIDNITPLEYNGKEVRETEYLTDAFSREAVSFVKKADEANKPFFLYLAYNAPHLPLQAKKEDIAKFEHIKDAKRRTYAAMVYAVDRGIAKLIEKLKANEQYENTLIVFLSDNGGAIGHGASNFPLLGGKGDTFEGGYRTPMFFHWPKGVNGGKRFEHTVTAIDFYPTFARLAGADIPQRKKLDGKDIWDDFLANKPSHKGEPVFCLRHRTGYSDVGVRIDNWKAVKMNNQPWQLFNIEEDIEEKNDLSAQFPERLNTLVKHAEKWSQTHIEPHWFHDEQTGEEWKEYKMPRFDNTFRVD